MRRIITTTALTIALATAAPALAKSSQKFESSLTAPLPSAVKVEVVIGEDLAHRADNLPKNIRDRGHGVRNLRSGFSNNGFYGERDLNRLADRLQSRMERRLEKKGVSVAENAATTLRLVITDARPNRPTFNQLSREPGLSFQSFGNGGAAIEGQIIGAGGQSIGDMSYAWYDRDINDAAYSSTWSDAHRAFDLFARQTTKKLVN